MPDSPLLLAFMLTSERARFLKMANVSVRGYINEIQPYMFEPHSDPEFLAPKSLLLIAYHTCMRQGALVV